MHRHAGYVVLSGASTTHGGFGLEEALSQGAHLYLAGHEHVFQHHCVHGVKHVVCGASGGHPSKFYGPASAETVLNWVDESFTTGFVVRPELLHAVYE